jgi:hypothetical protein
MDVPMEPRTFATFGQELYLRETLKAAAILTEAGLHRGVTELVAPTLDHRSAKTRRRIAAKLVQRLAAGAREPQDRAQFVRLVAGINDTAARRELVYYGVTRADPLVGAIAGEVLYPALVDRTTPQGARQEDMAPHRAGLLLTVEPVVPLDFLLTYAADRWHYRSRRSILLALRILRQVGIARSFRLRGASGAVEAIALSPHDLSLAAFIWCFMDEFGRTVPAPTVDRVQRSAFARAFIVPPALVDARLEQAEDQRFLRTRVMAGARRVVPAMSLEQSVTRLLGG